jgi:ABC-type branched-subunit amino acid transport system substrate-binding protein
MKILNKIILLSAAVLSFNQANAYNMPPVTNKEIKAHAQTLIRNDLPNLAAKYYKELGRRGDKLNSIWGLALVDMQNHDNKEALKKIEYLLTQEKVDTNKLSDLKAELLVNLAELSYFETKPSQAAGYLNSFYTSRSSDPFLKMRADEVRAKIENRKYKQNIKIGVILPLTGKLANIGQKVQQALTLALYDKKMTNISLIFEDNQSTQEGSIEAATNLLNHGPQLFIGPILRDNVLAANTIISSTNIPMFAFSNDKSIANGNIFLNNINMQQEAAEIAKFAYDNYNFKLACLTANDTSGNLYKNGFTKTADVLGAAVTKCESYNKANIDITSSIKKMLDVNKHEAARKRQLRVLEKKFEKLGNAMPDEELAKLEELKKPLEKFEIDFDAIFIPANANRVTVLAPQLAYYDIDFSSNVLFLGNSAWDNNAILKNRGEHLHFSRFLSLKTPLYNKFIDRYGSIYNEAPNQLAAFAYDILLVAQELDFNQNIYQQLYRPYGFSVMTGNVSFTNNQPFRQYGINKIARRSIKPVIQTSYQKAIKVPSNLEIERSSGLGGWFGF